jgi:hypothetical protein
MIEVLLFIVGILFLALIIIILLGTSVPKEALVYKPANTKFGYISRNPENIAIVSDDHLQFQYTPDLGFFQALIPDVGVRCLASTSQGDIIYEECIPSISTKFSLGFAKISQGDKCLVANSDNRIVLGNCENPRVLSIVPINCFSCN